jgi:hypothetical protein
MVYFFLSSNDFRLTEPGSLGIAADVIKIGNIKEVIIKIFLGLT